jgi:PAS domain S-box-containing protein
VDPVRAHAEVTASLAPTAQILGAALRDAAWDAVVVVPGGPVQPVEMVGLLTGQTMPVVVTGGAVPPELLALAPLAIPPERMGELPDRLALRKMPASDAFVGAANAVFGAAAAANAAIPGVLATASHRTPSHEPAAPAAPVAGARIPAPARSPAPPVASRAAAPPSAAPPSAAPPSAAPRPVAPPSAAPPSAAPPSAADLELEALRRHVEHLPIGVYRTSADGRILFANPALATVLRVRSVSLFAKLDVRRDLGYPREAFEAEMAAHGAVRNLVVPWVHARGERLWTRENARAVCDPSGRLLYYEGTMEDVTAEVTARQAEQLRSRQYEAIARFAEVAESARSLADLQHAAVESMRGALQADWILLVRNDGTGARCTAWAGTFSDAAAEALNADPFFQAAAPSAKPLVLSDAEAEAHDWLPDSVRAHMRTAGMRSLAGYPLLRGGESLGTLYVGYQTLHLFSVGEQQVAETLAWHLTGYLGRHAAEEELRDSEQTLRFLAEHSSQAVYRLRYAEGGSVFDYLSPAIGTLTGFGPETIRRAADLSAHIQTREVIEGDGLVERPAAEGGAQQYLAFYELRTATGELRWIENSAYPWLDADGTPIGLVGALRDVTERKRREDEEADAAQQASAQQAAIVELARRGGDEAAGLMQRAVELACEVAGVDDASIWLGEGPWMVCRSIYSASRDQRLVTPSCSMDVFEATLRLLFGQRSLVFDDAVADERIDAAGLRPFADTFGVKAFVMAPVRRAGEAIGMVIVHRTDEPHRWTAAECDFVGAVADAVALAIEREERASAEHALRLSETRYRALADLASDYAYALAVRPDGRRDVVWATDAFAGLSGYAPHEVASDEGFLAIVAEGSRLTVADALDELNETGETDFEAEILTRDGEPRWVRHRARHGERMPDGAQVVYQGGQDISQSKAFERELVVAREHAERGRAAAEEMARLKSSFLANMSHEIRTPLTAVLGYADLLSEEVSPEQRELVDLITRGGHRLLDTLNSVLDLSRLEADGVHPHLAPLDLGAEVAQSLRMLAPLAEQRGLSLSLTAEPNVTAALDGACLARIVTNLVGNAIKFTEEGGVQVTVAADGPEARLVVADTGIGIPRNFLPYLFDEFRQETTGQARSHEGSGLGLAITERLVRIMGGRIEVQSRRPGGSTFTVTFPATEPVPPADADAGGLARNVQRRLPSDLPSATIDFQGPVRADFASSARPGAFDSHSEPYLSTPSALSDGHETETSSPDLAPPVLPDPVPSTSDPTDPASTAMFDFRFGSAATPDPSAPSPAGASAPAVDTDDVQVFFTSPPPAVVADVAPAPVLTAPAPVAEASGLSQPSFTPSVAQAPPAEPVMIVRAPRPEPPATPPAAPAEQGEGGGDGRPYVLVVEDNNDTRMLLERILKSTYNVTAVGDARSALLAMNQTRFRGLVLDINLGGKETGADVLRIARALPGYDGVFAIALTAYALPGDRERLLEAGFDEYISKPFTRQSLMEALAAGVQA